MDVSQQIWAAFTALLGIGITSAGWFYTRLSKVHDRIEKVVNHMTDEDGKLHTKIDVLRETSVRRDEMLLHMGRIERTQEAILNELKGQNDAWRHKVGNIEQVAVRHDERLKHLEKLP